MRILSFRRAASFVSLWKLAATFDISWQTGCKKFEESKAGSCVRRLGIVPLETNQNPSRTQTSGIIGINWSETGRWRQLKKREWRTSY